MATIALHTLIIFGSADQIGIVIKELHRTFQENGVATLTHLTGDKPELDGEDGWMPVAAPWTARDHQALTWAELAGGEMSEVQILNMLNVKHDEKKLIAKLSKQFPSTTWVDESDCPGEDAIIAIYEDGQVVFRRHRSASGAIIPD